MANPVLLNVLIQDLLSTNEASQKQAAELLSLLTRANVEHRSFLAKNAAAIKALIYIASKESHGSAEELAFAEQSVAILFHLLLNEELVSNLGLLGVVKPITQNVMRTTRRLSVRENAAGALLCLSKLDAHKAPIGIYGGIVGLLSLMPSCSDRGKQDSLKALIHLLMYDGNKTLAARNGAAPLLLDMLTDCSPSHDQRNLVLSVLKSMASHSEGVSAIAAASGVKSIATALIDMTYGASREKAALTLLRILRMEPSLAEHLDKEQCSHKNALYSCLSELSIHGSRKGRRAATSLLKLFMDIEVGKHSPQPNFEIPKKQNEQDEEDGEELAEARLIASTPRHYGELASDTRPVISSKEQPIDIEYDIDNDDNDSDLNADDGDGAGDGNDVLDIHEDGADADQNYDGAGDIDYASDDTSSVSSSNCIEVVPSML